MAGWANYLKDEFNVLDDETKELSTKRLLICNRCDLRTGNVCDRSKGGCGCPITQKSFSSTSSCPLKKW